MTAPTPPPTRAARRTGRAMASTAATALILTLLASCSGQSSTSTLPAYTPSSSTATPTSTPTGSGPVPPTPLGYTPGDPAQIGAWIDVTKSAATTPDQKAAVQAWTAYWQLAMRAYNTYGENLLTSAKPLDAVATGKARSDLLRRISLRREGHLLTVGQVLVTITNVQIQGNKAVIHGCADDRSYEVDAKGKAVAPAPGHEPLNETLTRSGTSWLVTEMARALPAGDAERDRGRRR